MAQLDFYANTNDMLEVIDYLFTLAPMRLFESYSQKDKEILEFRSSKDILDSPHIENNHGRVFVIGWWESVTSRPYTRRFDLSPSIGKFRYSLEGVGTFQLNQGGLHDLAEKSLNISRFSHWNEKGARQRANFSDDDIEEVNWQEFRRLSGKVHRYLRNNMPRAKLFKRPILTGAYADLEDGQKLFGQPGIFSLGSKEIET